MSNGVPYIFDERRRRARYERALARQQRPDAARWLLDAMAEDVLERLAFLRWEGARALVSGLGSEAVAAALGLVPARELIDFSRPLAGGPYELIVSLGELDTVNDLPGALILLRAALAPGGLLLATMTGAGSLPQLRQAMLIADGERPAPRIHPQLDHRAASALLQRAGFARQVVDHHALEVRYSGLETLLADLHDQGLGSVLAEPSPPLGRAARERAIEAFGAGADTDGRTSEVFEVLTLTAWKD